MSLRRTALVLFSSRPSTCTVHSVTRICCRHRGYRMKAATTSFKVDPLVRGVLAESEPQNHGHDDDSKLSLPRMDDWLSAFPSTMKARDRVSLRNPDTAKLLADAFVPHGSKDKVILEAYPGPGQLTRALLNLPKERIKQLIVMEDYGPYLEYLRPLESVDPRVKVIPTGGFSWATYQTIENLGLMDDVQKLAWSDGVHQQLQFISHLPSSVVGEQLMAQFLRSIPDRQWLFNYGRVPLNFVLGEYLWKRMIATTKDSARCKLTLITEAVAQCHMTLPYHYLQPYDQHFHPARPSPGEKASKRRVGNPFQTATVLPLVDSSIQPGKLEIWDYCLRRLYVRKSTPFKGALATLAPGAESLLKKVASPSLPPDQRINADTQIRDMTVQDWKVLVDAFEKWPFAPQYLSIYDSFTGNDDRI